MTSAQQGTGEKNEGVALPLCGSLHRPQYHLPRQDKGAEDQREGSTVWTVNKFGYVQLEKTQRTKSHWPASQWPGAKEGGLSWSKLEETTTKCSSGNDPHGSMSSCASGSSPVFPLRFSTVQSLHSELNKHKKDQAARCFLPSQLPPNRHPPPQGRWNMSSSVM
jgi:hypothetical protein